MLNNFPNTFTLVQYHVGDAYATTWGNSRWTFYSGQGTPTAWFDGTIEEIGASSTQQAYTTYLGHYNTRRAAPTDVTIQLTGTIIGYSMCVVRARVCLEPGGTSRTVRIQIVQALDHWPQSPSYSRNCFKQASAFADVALTPGNCQIVERTLNFDGDSWAHTSDIRIIAWAQQISATSPATIYQAARMSWPFQPDCNGNGIPDAEDIADGTSLDCNGNGVPDECDLAAGTSHDCNNNGIPDECDIASGYSLDLNGNGIPDECDFAKGDLNCDHHVNFADINPFVLLLSCRNCYEVSYPNCDWATGDINGDGNVNFADINPFVAALTHP